ncbi:MAG: TetR/AcrR family transcriptional regulator [Eubacteriales bacterium]|nr:TetR/AcrR family transcriptional regulator [Eubacteriales bacterium]
MPKTFSESERAYIQERLKTEAKKCLATYGIRKTTIDELVKRVNIPKGTFYLFYESKERLLFEVIMEFDAEAQSQMLQEVSSLPGGPDAESFTDIILRFYQKLDESFLPRLMQNGELEYFMRTVPPELSRQHAERDKEAMSRMFAAFPNMKQERVAAFSAAFRGVFLTMLLKDEIGAEAYDDALRIMIRGIALQMMEAR